MILKELLKDFHDTKNLKILKSKKTNIVYVKGKYASIIKKIPALKKIIFKYGNQNTWDIGIPL